MIKTIYQLSSKYEFIEDAPSLTAQGYESIVLHHKADGDVLLLTPFIVSFLKAFEQPATLRDVTRLFQKTVEGSLWEIEAILKPFLVSMLQREILELIQPNAELVEKPQMPNGEGLELGIYTLQKRLSCTPPIDIYLAMDNQGQQVLLKRLLFAPRYPEKYRSSERRKFAHEFKILKILRGCPGVCSLIDFDKKNDFGVIEFFEGFSLRSRVQNQPIPLTFHEKVFVFKQILETMAFIHSRHVLHGDLHYSNILLNDKNEVKIIDFDLAFLSNAKEQRHVQQGGIRDFIPPERIDDSAFEVSLMPPDFRSEVFQIGVIGYFIFFGDYPFKGETWKALAKNIRESNPNWSNTDTPMPIILFLKKALAKNPIERFASAEAMLTSWTY